jgi:hypothetical protein
LTVLLDALRLVGIEMPAGPFTISFGSAASLVLESLPRKRQQG